MTAFTKAFLSTGFASIDRMLNGGFWVPSIVVVAGPPGVGKTPFLAKVAARAVSRGHRTLYATNVPNKAYIRRLGARAGGAFDSVPMTCPASLDGYFRASEKFDPTLSILDTPSFFFGETKAADTAIAQMAERALKDATDRTQIIIVHTKRGTLEPALSRRAYQLASAVVCMSEIVDYPGRFFSISRHRYGDIHRTAALSFGAEGFEEMP